MFTSITSLRLYKRLGLSPSFLNSSLLSTIVVTISAFIASFFAYFLQTFLGNTISVSDFGTFNSLLALSVVLSIPVSSFTNAVIKVVAELRAQEDFQAITALFRRLSVWTLIFGAFLTVLLLLFIDTIAAYFKTWNYSILLWFFVFLGFNVFATLPQAYLQGLLRFKALAYHTVFTGLVRMLFPIAFVLLGFDLSYLFVGFILAFLLSYLNGIILLRKNFVSEFSFDKELPYKKIISLSISAGFLLGGMTVLNNVDLIVVKHNFSELDAGIYSSVVTVGKILLFGAGTVASVMYPSVIAVKDVPATVKKRFIQFGLVQLFFLGVGMLAFFIFPGFIIRTLFSESFLPAAQYLPLFSIFICFYVLASFLLLFLFALDYTKVWRFSLPVILIQYFGLLYTTTLWQVIIFNTVLVTFLFFILLVIVLRKLL